MPITYHFTSLIRTYQSNPPHANVCTLTWSQTRKYLMLYTPYSKGQPFGSRLDWEVWWIFSVTRLCPCFFLSKYIGIYKRWYIRLVTRGNSPEPTPVHRLPYTKFLVILQPLQIVTLYSKQPPQLLSKPMLVPIFEIFLTTLSSMNITDTDLGVSSWPWQWFELQQAECPLFVTNIPCVAVRNTFG
jgi:hypothetical protein